jgi:hypothetical protein
MEFLEEGDYIFDFLNGRIIKRVKGINVNGIGKKLAAYTFIICGTNHKGYKRLRYKSNRYLVHRILYEKYYNIKLESGQDIDHINQNRCDNRIINLRNVNASQNGQNTTVKRNNKLGIKNIRFTKSNTYEVYISYNETKYSKLFKTLPEAIAWRNLKYNEFNKQGACFHIG